MRFLRPLCLALLLSTQVTAQNYTPKPMDFDKIPDLTASNCPKEVLEQLNLALEQLERQESESAVATTEAVFKKTSACAQIYDAYSWSLFRNGKWDEAMAISDKAFALFGKNEHLIRRRGYMCLEMAELGLGAKHIDGNSVFSPNSGDKKEKSEEAFKEANYKAACEAFEYIAQKHNDKSDIMMVGYAYRRMSNYAKSNAYYAQLLEDDEYKGQAIVAIVENNIAAKDFEKAEKTLLELEQKYPKAIELHKLFIKLYTAKGDKDKVAEHKQKGFFYAVTPRDTQLAYSAENYETLVFFAKDNKEEEKLQKLQQLVGKRDNNAAEICLSILKMHENHGNGLEERAAEELGKMGSAIVPKAISLFQEEGISTCTITKLADLLAASRDAAAFDVLVDYLPKMARLPFTIIPPDVPSAVMECDQVKGAKALVSFVRTLIQEEQVDKKNPDKPFDFATGMFYAPLRKVAKSKIKAYAKEANYTDKELKILLDKLKKND